MRRNTEQFIHNFLLFLLFTALLPAGSELSALEPGWYTGPEDSPSNSSAMKTVKGFGGALIITPDQDWEEKWASDSPPQFSIASQVNYGESLTILTLFANPATDKKGEIRILCDIKISRPDGTSSVLAQGAPCAGGKLQGDPRNVRLTSAIIKYVGEEGDPPGVWIVDVTVTDAVRGAGIPLQGRFELLKKK